MVRLNKIYTRTGDAGTTGLGSGERVAKDAPRVAAYGSVDETNATIGLARAYLTGQDSIDAQLCRIQNDLFDLGADLCVPDRGAEQGSPEQLRILEEQAARLEAEIDALNSELNPLKSFILPGGSPAAAALHLARTVCRRAERDMVTLSGLPDEPVSAAALKYINRLSDFLFVASRYVNDRGQGDVLWVPGQNR
jgi:cob(I)alamin adenosyltransferase